MAKGAAISGSCLCGAYQFEVEGPLANVRLCHCDLCRKANGSAFSANCRLPTSRYLVVRDDGHLRRYESSKGVSKYFCDQCGSPTHSLVDWDKDHIRIRLGTLDRHAQAEITAHVWVGSKAAWDTIADDLPCFDKGGT